MDYVQQHWWLRLQSALDTEKEHPGYYKWPMADRNVLKMAPCERWRMGKTKTGKYTTGACGHHGTWLMVGLVGDAEARIGATGMNMTDSWNHKASKWSGITPRSSATVALLDGSKQVKDKSGQVYTCRDYAPQFLHFAVERMSEVVNLLEGRNGVAIVECPSHIEVALSIPLGAGIKHPITGAAMVGVWQYSADGSSKSPGQPHTLRPWKLDELGAAMHVWFLPAGVVCENWINWRIIVE